MAAIILSPADTLLKILLSKPISIPGIGNLKVTTTTSTDVASTITVPDHPTPIAGPNSITKYLSPYIFTDETYTPAEEAEISQWLTLSTLNQALPTEKYLTTLNTHLKTRTTLLGEKSSVADIAAFVRLRVHIENWSAEQRTGGEKGGWRYIVRWADYVQNAGLGGLEVPAEVVVKVDPGDVKTVLGPDVVAKEKKEGAADGGKKDKKKKGAEATVVVPQETKAEEKAGASTAAPAPVAAATGASPAEGGKKKDKPKKEKAPKASAPKKEAPPLSPVLFDLRVGKILKCVPHPNADSLFMSTVTCGDAPDSPYINPESATTDTPTRTVLSGLRGKIPIEEMQNRMVVLVCNLKPANMRGIKSSAMVLAASPRPDAHGKEAGLVELVMPPEGAKIGDKVVFEGYDQGNAEAMLNPKTKVWETLSPGMGTDAEGNVVFEGERAFTGAAGEVNDKALAKGTGKLVVVGGGVCRVATLKGAVVR